MEKAKVILREYYKKIKQLPKPESYQIGGTFYGATEIFSTVGNCLEMVENGMHISYGYACSRTIYKNACFLKIGSAYKYPLREIEKDLEKVLGTRYNYETKIGLICDRGTNYSVIGFGVIKE